MLKVVNKAGGTELKLADTAGVADPDQVGKLIERTKAALPQAVFSLHFNNTKNLGIANMLTRYEAGGRNFDTSGERARIPFAPAVKTLPLAIISTIILLTTAVIMAYMADKRGLVDFGIKFFRFSPRGVLEKWRFLVRPKDTRQRRLRLYA